MNNLNDIPLVISYENDLKNNVNSQFYKNSLDKYNWKYSFIGDGEKWNGFKTRMNAYYNYLELLEPSKIVILTDARDVICTRDVITFINHIKQLTDIENKIIISTEMFLIGHMDWSEEAIAKVTANDPSFFWQGIPINNYWEHNKITNIPLKKYVNAGLIIGKVINLKNALKWIIDNNYTDDQLGFANFTNIFPEKVYLDYENEILHTSTFGVDGGLYSEKQKYDSPSFAEMLGMSSYFLHIPGLSSSKGQQHIYDLVVKSLSLNIFKQENELFKLYGITIRDDLIYNYFYKNE